MTTFIWSVLGVLAALVMLMLSIYAAVVILSGWRRSR